MAAITAKLISAVVLMAAPGADRRQFLSAIAAEFSTPLILAMAFRTWNAGSHCMEPRSPEFNEFFPQ